jgi:predicted small lipoprotein YifL
MRRVTLAFAAALILPALVLGGCGKRGSLVRDPVPPYPVPAPMPAQGAPSVADPPVKPAKPILEADPFGSTL